MIRPKANPLSFPDRVDVLRESATAGLDASGGRAESLTPIVLAMPCRIDRFGLRPADVGQEAAQYPAAVTFAVRPDITLGDVLMELDGDGRRTGTGYRVERLRPAGMVYYHRWVADCTIRV